MTWWSGVSPLSALVCLNCGRVKLVASDLENLRRHAQKNPDHFAW
jgi:hypothetical protein